MAKELNETESSALNGWRSFFVLLSVKALILWLAGLALAAAIHRYKPGYGFTESLFTARSFAYLAAIIPISALEVLAERRFPPNSTKWWLHALVQFPFTVAFVLAVFSILV